MKKANIYNVNRNNPFNPFERSNYPINATPDVVLKQRWLQVDTPQVEIIELNTDDSKSTMSDEDRKYGHMWSYIDNNHDADEFEHVRDNVKDKEKKIAQNGTGDHSQILSLDDIDNAISDVVTDFVYSSFYESNQYTSNYTIKNHQRNCFTILNTSFDSDSSSEVDVMDCNDSQESWDSHRIRLDETFDNKKHTLLIYSIKNKHRLEEDHLDLVNVPSQDWSSSTSNSFENFAENVNTAVKETSRRVGSPIPATYVPRLNLMSPRLPTLTEVREPTIHKHTRKENAKNRNINRWCDSEQDKSSVENETKIINWMCLSPRERRRFKHKNTTSIEPKIKGLVPGTESKVKYSLRETPNFLKFETKAEVNGTPRDNLQNSHSSRASSFDPKSDSNMQKNATLLSTNDFDTKNNRGPERHDENNLRKPKVIIKNENFKKMKEITYTIEMDSNNWMEEKNLCLDQNENKGQRLIQTKSSPNNFLLSPKDSAVWARNKFLINPADSKENEVTTDSIGIPSLQLSIDTNEDKRFWVYRLVSCFKCCCK